MLWIYQSKLKEITKFIGCLSSDYNRIKNLIIEKDFISELKLASNYLFIPDAILQLETNGLIIQSQMLEGVRKKN